MPATTQAQRAKILVIEGRIEELQKREIPAIRPIPMRDYDYTAVKTGTKAGAPRPAGGVKYGPPALALDGVPLVDPP